MVYTGLAYNGSQATWKIENYVAKYMLKMMETRVTHNIVTYHMEPRKAAVSDPLVPSLH